MKKKRTVMLGEKAYNQMRKEIERHWNQCIGQSIAELAIELTPDEETEYRAKRPVQIKIEEETWNKLKEKAMKEGTSISRIYERTLWERADLE